MNALTVRLATAADFAAIAATTNHYIRHTAVHFGHDEVQADELRSLWLEHESRYPWLVGESDGDFAGYAKAGVFRSRTAYRWLTETAIYLPPAQRGRGFGQPLYARLLDLLRAQGFHAAIGVIALPNPDSVRLHEQLGFAASGLLPRAGWKFERWHDVGFWQLPLQPPTHRAGPLLSPAEAFATSVS